MRQVAAEIEFDVETLNTLQGERPSSVRVPGGTLSFRNFEHRLKQLGIRITKIGKPGPTRKDRGAGLVQVAPAGMAAQFRERA